MSGFDQRKMADNYKPDFGLMWQPVLPRESLAKMTDRQLWEYGNARKQVEEFAGKNPVGSGWILPSWKKVMDDWQSARIIVILGGNRCVRGDTPIYDPVLNVTRRIDSIRGEHHVLASDSLGHKIIAKAEQPFEKPGGEGDFLRITLGTGKTFDASPAHRVLKANSYRATDNKWEFCANLKVNDWLWGDEFDSRVDAIEPAPRGVYWDMTVPVYDNYIACGVIHHNSSKSSLAARMCVWAMGTIPECEARAYHINGERSKQDQQRFIWDALPHSLKNLPTKRSASHTVQYTQANGFTGDKMILPPLEGWTKGGQITFANYASYSNDAQVAEGFKSHVIWLDEEAPEALFKTLMQRTTDYRGRIIVTFTVVDGWSSLVQQILGKVKTLEYRNAPLLNNRRVPVLQESLQHEGMKIHYFWTEDNPFVPVDEFRSKMRGLPEDEILARAYGIPTKSAKSAFPLFSRDVNVIKHENLPFIKNPNYAVTRYMVIDLGGSKNDFIAWFAIDSQNTVFCYREWPDFDTYGEWALPGPTVDGKAGPAQKSLGMGIQDEVELLLHLEDKEPIFERLVDPRAGASERKGDEGITTPITDFEKFGLTLIPAPGLDIKSGLKLINSLLFYNPEKPRDSRNSPRFYVSDRCENVISMFCDYTASTMTENSKEAPDLLRYLLTSSAQHFSKEDMDVLPGAGGY